MLQVIGVTRQHLVHNILKVHMLHTTTLTQGQQREQGERDKPPGTWLLIKPSASNILRPQPPTKTLHRLVESVIVWAAFELIVVGCTLLLSQCMTAAVFLLMLVSLLFSPRPC